MRTAYRRAAAAGAAVLLVGAVATTARADEDPSERYRVAVATIGDVEETLSLSGAVDHANRSDVGFDVDGTVGEVYVDQGDRVRRGQKLAELDTSDLEAAVTEARAALARAKAQLEQDQQAQADAVEESTPEQPTQPTPTAPQPETDPALEQALMELAAQQQAVREAQSAAILAIAEAKAALAAQQEACALEEPTTDAELSSDNSACTEALANVQALQDVVAQAQDALQQTIGSLTETLTRAVQAVTGGEDDYVDVPAVAMETPSETPPATPSAGSIAADQAAIDQARSDLLTAQHALRAAVLRAPRGGTVAALDIADGDAVAAGTPVVTVIGPGRTTVTSAVSIDQVRDLAVGQRATVRLPGRDRAFRGRVTSIGVLPSSAEDGTTYPVVITLDGGGSIPSGSTASVDVVVSTAQDVVTVPLSAVSAGSVRVLSGEQVEDTPVTVGTVGTTRMQVTGIEAGTTVVLADRAAAIPDGDTSGDFRGPMGATFGTVGGGPNVVRIPG